MALPKFQTESTTLQIAKSEEIIENYVFETPTILPAAEWELHIAKGYAWVFCSNGNFLLKPNESIVFTADDGEITIKRQYVKSVVKFIANRVA